MKYPEYSYPLTQRMCIFLMLGLAFVLLNDSGLGA